MEEVNQPWQRLVPQDLRDHLIRKIIIAIFPEADDFPDDVDQQQNIYEDAREIERQTFNLATSREHYYELLAERIYSITREIERNGRR
ncbi:unnamed protein product [Caenorhabditis nigoni]